MQALKNTQTIHSIWGEKPYLLVFYITNSSSKILI